MHVDQLHQWQHSHAFGSEISHGGERRTRWVIALTACMMAIELAGGLYFSSMALLADAWHMATHAAALGIAAFAYAYARSRSNDPRYSFGTGKIGALGGFTSAVCLAGAAVLVLAESISRLFAPVEIRFDEAIGVACLGLVVNLACAAMLRGDHHEEAHDHHDHPDHNLRGAYLHVLADALTSILAIAALVAGKLLGWNWMDAIVGILGAIVIAHWSLGLLRNTSAVLLDAEVGGPRYREIRAAIESDADNRVCDLHVWRIGPRHFAVIVSVVTVAPRDPKHYKELLRRFDDLAHVTVEVHACGERDTRQPPS